VKYLEQVSPIELQCFGNILVEFLELIPYLLHLVYTGVYSGAAVPQLAQIRSIVLQVIPKLHVEIRAPFNLRLELPEGAFEGEASH